MINILTLVLSEKTFLNETKNHNPPFKLNGQSLMYMYKGNQAPGTANSIQSFILSQLFIGPRIPCKSIFESSFLCGTVSKALEKSNSKMATSVCSPALYAFMKSWSVTNS
jgi:hypothetical protein